MIQKLIDKKMVSDFRELISRNRTFVLTCHVRPDGDALGSTLGLYHLLKSFGKDVAVLTPDVPPRSLSFIPGFKEIVPFTKYSDYAVRLVNEAEVLVCCDFNKINRLEDLSPIIASAKAIKVHIDHHMDPDNFGDITFSYPEMSSTCELVFRIIAAMGHYDSMPFDSATCICTGIITDTRNLSVNCHYIDLYVIVEELLKKGVNKDKIVKLALETKSLSSLRLHAYAIYEKLKIYKQHRAALIYLTKEDLEKFDYEKGDTEGLVNEALQIEGIVYSIFLREDTKCIKVSTRSVDKFPVCKICEDHFEGGGHLQAAGGQFYGSMDDCIKLVEKVLPQYDSYLSTKDDKSEIDNLE